MDKNQIKMKLSVQWLGVINDYLKRENMKLDQKTKLEVMNNAIDNLIDDDLNDKGVQFIVNSMLNKIKIKAEKYAKSK